MEGLTFAKGNRMKKENRIMRIRRNLLAVRIAAMAMISLILTGCLLPPITVSASQATSYTYTLNEKGHYVRTQDAYLPDKTITDLGLMKPEDIYIDENDMLYIADTQNKRIVKYNIQEGKISDILSFKEFTTPKGVFVTENGDIYVADVGAKKVFHFDKNFNLIESIGRPEAPSFSDTPFEPSKIAVDKSGNMYIIGEGVYNGVIQLSIAGEFLGYFTVNKTKLTFMQAMQNAIFTRAQLENLIPRVPTTFSNIFLDNKGIVYTTTIGSNNDGLKKHNTAGGNMFKDPVWSYDSLTDVFVDNQGIIYTSNSYGYMDVYSSSGELIFEFGSFISDLDISGLYTSLPSLAVDREGDIWTIDGDKGYVQSFKPTDYAKMVYNSIGLYEKGLYKEALDKWNEVLKLNEMSVLAHNGVGKAYLHAGQYKDAMEHFKVAGNRKYYSEAFWEVRNTWIQERLKYFVGIIFTLWLISFIVKKIDKKKRVREIRRNFWSKISSNHYLRGILYGFRVPRHPLDRYYDIRVKRGGSVFGATILYLLMFISFMAYQTKKGFVYQFKAVEDMDINAIVIGFFFLLFLFIVSNYLVTSIKEGDGSFKQVYMIPAYSMIPVITSMVSITALSYFLTTNEAFILTIILYIGVVWSIILIFIGFLTVHDYTFRENVMSLILTFIFMIIAAIMLLIIIIMWERLWQFLLTLGKEITQNVL